jgi:hypothetical protein
VHADRPETDEHDVPAHAGDAFVAERLCEPAADERVRQQREQGRHERRAGDDQADAERLDPRRLVGEGEVAEADRGDGLDREVDRVEDRQVRVVPGPVVAEVQHERGDQEQHQAERGGDAQRPVGDAENGPQNAAGRGACARAYIRDLLCANVTVAEPGRIELLVGPEQRHAVSGADALVAAGARDQRVVGLGDDADRREAAIEFAQRPLARRDRLGGDEQRVAEEDVAGTSAEAGFDDRGCKQRTDVEHTHRAEHLLDRARDRRVVEVGDDADLRSQVANQQHRLERAQIGALGAHDRGGAEDAGVE